jgi:PleD family two-component response regulator
MGHVPAPKRREDARVLIIDDDASMAMFCANVLAHRGISTRGCCTPRA